VLAEQGVTLIQSAIRGRNPDPDKPHLADLDIQCGRVANQARLPVGRTEGLGATHSPTKELCSHLELSVCQGCPLLKENKCLAQVSKRDGRYRLRFTQADAQASQRRRRSQENKHRAGNLRAAVEATVRSVKLPFPEAQLPVRGKFRVTCMLIGSAAVANVRRINATCKPGCMKK